MCFRGAFSVVFAQRNENLSIFSALPRFNLFPQSRFVYQNSSRFFSPSQSTHFLHDCIFHALERALKTLCCWVDNFPSSEATFECFSTSTKPKQLFCSVCSWSLRKGGPSGDFVTFGEFFDSQRGNGYGFGDFDVDWWSTRVIRWNFTGKTMLSDEALRSAWSFSLKSSQKLISPTSCNSFLPHLQSMRTSPQFLSTPFRFHAVWPHCLRDLFSVRSFVDTNVCLGRVLGRNNSHIIKWNVNIRSVLRENRGVKLALVGEQEGSSECSTTKVDREISKFDEFFQYFSIICTHTLNLIPEECKRNDPKVNSRRKEENEEVQWRSEYWYTIMCVGVYFFFVNLWSKENTK